MKDGVIQLGSYILRTQSLQFYVVLRFCGSRDSSVDIATGYGLDARGLIPGRGKRYLSSPQRPDRFWGPIQWAPGVEWPERQADSSPPSNVKFKNGGAISALPHPSSWSDA
jgi:hypothetical protein